MLESISSSYFSPLFQPTFFLFDLCAAMSHYHENDQDVCQDKVKEFSANSRPWVDEKWGYLLSITALNPRHVSVFLPGNWEEFKLHLLPTMI